MRLVTFIAFLLAPFASCHVINIPDVAVDTDLAGFSEVLAVADTGLGGVSGNSTENAETTGNATGNTAVDVNSMADAADMRYCDDQSNPACVPTSNAAVPEQRQQETVPLQTYPDRSSYPTYPIDARDPRRFGPGPLPRGPPAACKARYLYHPEEADWEGARAICEMEGGQLAIITSEREQGRIASKFGKMDEFWIGATDIEREGQFRWVNGQGLGFARWYRSQPNKKYPNNEHCVTFNYWGKDTKWGDRNCFDSRPFLCETMICEPLVNRFPNRYPGSFRGPLRNPFTFPRNRNFPGPRGMGGVSERVWPNGRGFPYNSWHDIRAPIYH